jgi:hypothetical protein
MTSNFRLHVRLHVRRHRHRNPRRHPSAFPRQYISLSFDSNQAFLQIRDASWGDSLIVLSQPEVGVAAEGSQLKLELHEIIGKAGVDSSYVVDFFVPDLDANEKWTAASIS